VIDQTANPPSLHLPLQTAPVKGSLPSDALTIGSGVEASTLGGMIDDIMEGNWDDMVGDVLDWIFG
jgi:hypothetical protein